MSDKEGKKLKLSLIYHPRKAIDQVQQRSDIVPIRFFAVLFPLWSIEIEGVQKDGRPYQLVENYIERAILKASLQSTEELATFFGLEHHLAKKVVDFLSAIGHVTKIGGQLRLTPLGIESQEDKQKYIMMETRRILYFDGFLSKPLLRSHYDSRSMRFLSEQEEAELPTYHMGERFLRLYENRWNVQALYELDKRKDKAEYNVPDEVTHLQERSVAKVYTPMYIFETRRRTQQSLSDWHYLVYTGIQNMHDLFFEEIVNASPNILRSLYAEKEQDPSILWSNYITERGFSPRRLIRQTNGSWQLRLLADDLQSPKAQRALAILGSYWIEKGYFLHIWCDDQNIRRNAALDQILKIVEKKKHTITGKELDNQLLVQANTLKVQGLSRNELQHRAKKTGHNRVIQTLEMLSE